MARRATNIVRGCLTPTPAHFVALRAIQRPSFQGSRSRLTRPVTAPAPGTQCPVTAPAPVSGTRCTPRTIAARSGPYRAMSRPGPDRTPGSAALPGTGAPAPVAPRRPAKFTGRSVPRRDPEPCRLVGIFPARARTRGARACARVRIRGARAHVRGARGQARARVRAYIHASSQEYPARR